MWRKGLRERCPLRRGVSSPRYSAVSACANSCQVMEKSKMAINSPIAIQSKVIGGASRYDAALSPPCHERRWRGVATCASYCLEPAGAGVPVCFFASAFLGLRFSLFLGLLSPTVVPLLSYRVAQL